MGCKYFLCKRVGLRGGGGGDREITRLGNENNLLPTEL